MKYNIDKILGIICKVFGWVGISLFLSCYLAEALTGHPMPDLQNLTILSLILLHFSE